MNELRLIILGLGIALIAGLYLGEIVKQRRRQRLQTIRHSRDETGTMTLAPNQETDSADISGVIADLNDFLVRNKLHDDETIAEQLKIRTEVEGELSGRKETGEVRVISIFIRVPEDRSLSGDVIFQAAIDAGMVHGEMEIFHHFGLTGSRGDRPLFSMADMFEPGSFPVRQLVERRTRGLVMFFCLPAVVDARVILELMLNTAEQIAASLDAEVLGPHQEPLSDQSVSELRKLVEAQA